MAVPQDNTTVVTSPIDFNKMREFLKLFLKRYEELKAKYPAYANESLLTLEALDAQLTAPNTTSIKQDNRTSQERAKGLLKAKELLQRGLDAIGYNAALRMVGASDLSDSEAYNNPDAVAENYRQIKDNIGTAAALAYPIGYWMSALKAAGTAGKVAYHTINGATALMSAKDMYDNGVGFWNTLGVVFPALEYGLPTLNRAYNNYLFSKAFNRPLPLTEPQLNVGWGPKYTSRVSHKSNSVTPLEVYNPNRYDVVNEGANPLGIWYLGKLGVPRTIKTGATPEKATKAEKARKLFGDRTYTHYEQLTLNKPITTVGDVTDRSALSYKAELLGADGIIYNDIYDNGYNNNQVILSFKEPSNTRLGLEKDFISSLDWNPKHWFKTRYNLKWTDDDVNALVSHIPEYLQIEKDSKATGTWLLNGVDAWDRDPRSWVLLLSKNGRNLVPETMYTGVTSNPAWRYSEKFPEYSGTAWGGRSRSNVAEYARSGKSGDIKPISEEQYLQEVKNIMSNPKLTPLDRKFALWKLESLKLFGLGVEEGNGHIFEITYPRGILTRTLNANGAKWHNIYAPSIREETILRLEKEILELEKSTKMSDRTLAAMKKSRLENERISRNWPLSSDDIVRINKENGYPISIIENVIDNSAHLPMTDVIITDGIPRKSLLGNNGDFDLNKTNIYH